MSRRSHNLIKLFAVSTLLAVVTGYIAGILSAPKSGKRTIKDIVSTADKSKNKIESELNDLLDELGDLISEAKDQSGKASSRAQADARKMIDKGLITKDKVRDIIYALKKGDADDHDLKKAVKNASDSIDHLKDFLKK